MSARTVPPSTLSIFGITYYTLAIIDASWCCPCAIYLLTSSARADENSRAAAAAAGPVHRQAPPRDYMLECAWKFEIHPRAGAASSNQLDVIPHRSHRLSAFTGEKNIYGCASKRQRPIPSRPRQFMVSFRLQSSFQTRAPPRSSASAARRERRANRH